MSIGRMTLSEFVKTMYPEHHLNRFQTKVLDSTKPKCFGERPDRESNAYAENCCHDCPFGDDCARKTKDA